MSAQRVRARIFFLVAPRSMLAPRPPVFPRENWYVNSQMMYFNYFIWTDSYWKNSLSLIAWYYVDIFRFMKTVIPSSWLEQCQAEMYLQIPNHLLPQPFTHSPVSSHILSLRRPPLLLISRTKNLPLYHPLVSSRSAKLPRTTQRPTDMVSKESAINRPMQNI